ncbi:MAG: hypothetical protein HYY20_12825 [Candidatus Tectomicrobia bacterium]|uniref:Uncharacterized protein n=1 Tax=Tectimicrobiota bacterium TaxID=2528274 RepID=A0A932FZR0_UNCTE|nr:hypothetical protein [Candidatus Tectomicrobia bacterium]
MSVDRVFSPEELKALETPLADRIAAAIDAGRYEEAKALARQMEEESPPIIYILEEWVTALLSYIGRSQGDEALVEALRHSANTWMRPMHDGLLKLDFRGQVEGFAAIFRAHTGRGLRVEEDDEKVTLFLDPCGSGGRMVKGGYFGPPKDLLQVQKAQGITFGREGFPSYCTHCAVVHHIMPIEWAGAPLPPIEVGSGPGDPCKWHFYKDRAAIPARFYAQVGKEKK